MPVDGASEQRGERLMTCLDCRAEGEPDWATSRSLIHEQTVLVPSARPAVPAWDEASDGKTISCATKAARDE